MINLLHTYPSLINLLHHPFAARGPGETIGGPGPTLPGGWVGPAAGRRLFLRNPMQLTYPRYIYIYISYVFLQGRHLFRSVTRRRQDSKLEHSGFLQGRFVVEIFDPPEAGLPFLVQEVVFGIQKQIRDSNILVQYKHPTSRQASCY